MDYQEQIRTLRDRFALDWKGIHGAAHWARVRQNGLRLAESTGANTTVVKLFAIFHDSCRQIDGYDPLHGARASTLARELMTAKVSPIELNLLCAACKWHGEGSLAVDVTIGTCWDADRLDLGRIGIKPDPELLCTRAARNHAMIEWAYLRSIS